MGPARTRPRCTPTGRGRSAGHVYPDADCRRRRPTALRRGRFRDPGMRKRGPLGLGTEFESSARTHRTTTSARSTGARPNGWAGPCRTSIGSSATASRLHRRYGSPDGRAARRSNASARRRDRRGCLVARSPTRSPTGGEDHVRRRLSRPIRPRRRGARAVVLALFDLEPRRRQRLRTGVHAVGDSSGRSSSCSPTCSTRGRCDRSSTSIPMLTRRHAVVVALVTDPDLDDDSVRDEPASLTDVYEVGSGARRRGGANRLATGCTAGARRAGGIG